MNREWKSLLAILLCAAVLVSSPCAAPAAVPVAEDGQARAAIVHNGFSDFAEELQEYIEKMTGAALSLVECTDNIEDEPAYIELRIVDELPGVSEERTAEHAYRLRTDGGNLRITALTEVGLRYAVYGLLQDHLGVGFFTPSYEYIPDSPTLVIPEMDDVQEPSLYGRGMNLWAARRQTADWSDKNRGFPLGGHTIKAQHNFTRFGIPENCPLDEEFHRELGERLKERFEQREAGAAPMALGQRDGNFQLGCENCDRCEALIEEEGSYSAPMLVMLNAALEHAGQEYPDHQIITFAYHNTLPAPKTIRPHKNLWINIAASGRDHLNELRGNPQMTPYYGALRDWPQIAPGRVTTWHWARNYYARDYEWPNMASVVDTIRVWEDYGITAGFMQEDRAGTHNWAELKHWVWSQVLWDTGSDVDALMRRFLRGYYGREAYPDLWKYFQEVERVRVETDIALDAHSPERRMRRSLLTVDVLQRLDSLLQQAYEAALQEEDPAYAQRIADGRAYSIDKPIIDTLRETDGFARVEDPRDGSGWYVAGGEESVPARIERYLDREENPRHRLDFLARSGGRLFEIETDDLVAAVVPQKQCIEERSGGNIVSVVHKPSGRELLAGGGYRTRPSWAREAYWDIEEVSEDAVTAEAAFSHVYWHFSRVGTMSSSVLASEDNQGLEVERSYHVTRRHGSGDIHPHRYHAVWEFKLPEPGSAALTIAGGGLDESLTAEDFKTDALEFDVAEQGGSITIELDRGDGLTVRLRAENHGWEGIRIKPVFVDGDGDVPQHQSKRRSRWPNTSDVWPVDPTPRLEITLEDSDEAEMGEEPVELPRQRLEVIQERDSP